MTNNNDKIEFLKEKWKKDFLKEKEEWDKKPGWPAKYVETKFKIDGEAYSIRPVDIGLTDDCWDQGFMESVQKKIKDDLKQYGATDICSLGFMD